MNITIRVLIGLCVTGVLAPTILAGAPVEAVRTDAPPVIDGVLTDRCWEAGKPVRDFRSLGSKNAAPFSTEARVLYDDGSLYIGIKCDEPDVKKIKTAKREHEGQIFSDDSVEVMLDPGFSKTNYIQLAVNASGTKFDCSRLKAGAAEDDSWNGDWDAASRIGRDHWACEIRVPFHTLGATAKTPLPWGINVCRNKKDPAGYSSIAETGAYNEPASFRALIGLDADLSRYVVLLGEPRLVPEAKQDKLLARLTIPVTNVSDKPQTVVLEKVGEVSAEDPAGRARNMTLNPNEQRVVTIQNLALDRDSGKPDGSYALAARPATRKVQVRLPGDKDVVASRNVAVAQRLRVMQLRIVRYGIGQALSGLDVSVDPWAESLLRGRYRLAIEDSKGVTIHEAEGGVSVPLTRFRLPKAHLPSGELTGTVTLQSKKGVDMAKASLTFVHVKSKHKRLNTLVSELLTAELDLDKGKRRVECKFENPRNGWVFVSTTASMKDKGRLLVTLDWPPAGETRRPRPEPIMTHEKDGTETLEAMRFLPPGEHKLVVNAEAPASVSLVVRAIPALGFCKFGYHPRVAPYGPYDWAYLEKHVTPHVNYIVGAGSDGQNDVVKQWKTRGKKWLIECGVPGFVNAPKDITTAKGAYKYWASHRAFTDPLIDGGLADEFLTSSPKEQYETWTEAVRLLAKDEKLRGKKLYPYCTGTLPTLDHCRKFVEAAIETGGTIAWERYQIEKPTEEGARSFIEAQLKHSLLVWEKAIPDCRKHMIIVLGYLCTITAETQSIYPSVDFKYYLDMQCHLIANDPTFEGLYGLQTYTSGYADDETVRWICRLFRHYFIEGNTEMLSKRYGLKYNPAHLKNPDFADGMKGWDVRSAEEGSVATKSQPGYARMQGRMGTSFGDQFLWTKRSEKRPNVIRQKAVGLVPGKLYSLKLVTGNYDELQAGKSKKVRHGVSVTIDNVTMVNEKSFIHIQPNLYCYFIPPFSATNSFWFNHHHYVFRAKGEAATVTIMDWQNEKEPGAPIGQELMFNFVEMQPYYGEEQRR